MSTLEVPPDLQVETKTEPSVAFRPRIIHFAYMSLVEVEPVQDEQAFMAVSDRVVRLFYDEFDLLQPELIAEGLVLSALDDPDYGLRARQVKRLDNGVEEETVVNAFIDPGVDDNLTHVFMGRVRSKDGLAAHELAPSWEDFEIALNGIEASRRAAQMKNDRKHRQPMWRWHS